MATDCPRIPRMKGNGRGNDRGDGDDGGNFGATGGSIWAQGDFNYDGAVDLQDFGVLKASFGAGGAVPEPAVLSLAAISVLTLLRRTKR